MKYEGTVIRGYSLKTEIRNNPLVLSRTPLLSFVLLRLFGSGLHRTLVLDCIFFYSLLLHSSYIAYSLTWLNCAPYNPWVLLLMPRSQRCDVRIPKKDTPTIYYCSNCSKPTLNWIYYMRENVTKCTAGSYIEALNIPEWIKILTRNIFFF